MAERTLAKYQTADYSIRVTHGRAPNVHADLLRAAGAPLDMPSAEERLAVAMEDEKLRRTVRKFFNG